MSAVTTTTEVTPPIFTLNSGYPKTLPAILKIVQAVFALVAYLCAACAPWWTSGSAAGFRYFEWVCQWHMWSVIILYLIVLLNVHHRLVCIKWNLTAFLVLFFPKIFDAEEFIHYVLASIFFFTGSITAAALSRNGAMAAAAVFGFFCLFLYAFGAYVAFRHWRSEPATQPATV